MIIVAIMGIALLAGIGSIMMKSSNELDDSTDFDWPEDVKEEDIIPPALIEVREQSKDNHNVVLLSERRK